MMTLFLVARVPCGHGGRLVETIGVALTESDAVGMCSQNNDAIAQIEAGRHYPPGKLIDVPTRYPLCPEQSAWSVPKMLFGEG